MKKLLERLYNGIIKENPTFVLMLGMCPTLAVTTSAMNGIGMGLSTAAVLMMSNLIISLLRKLIPDRVRMPAYIVVVASFVTIVDLLMQAYVRSLYASLGLYIPLIVVNCIILGRAESYASKNPPLLSLFDGLGMGIGFTVALTLIGAFRELLGSGTIFGFTVLGDWYEPVALMVMAPGAFFVLAGLTALQNKLKAPSRTNDPDKFCAGDCRRCGDASCHIFNREQQTRDAAEPAAPSVETAAPAPGSADSEKKEVEQQ